MNRCIQTVLHKSTYLFSTDIVNELARSYLSMCDAHPGPVHVMELSVGATTALALAGMFPDRISCCIPMAPPLEMYEPVPNIQRSLINYIGPLGVAQFNKWDPNRPFPISAFAALGRFGGSISSSGVV